jgi:hypothetical protein
MQSGLKILRAKLQVTTKQVTSCVTIVTINFKLYFLFVANI